MTPKRCNWKVIDPKVHVLIEAKGDVLSRVALSLADSFSYKILGATPALKDSLISWLKQYRSSSPIPLSFPLEKQTPFQKKVLLEMNKIPFGKTISYQSLGEKCEMASSGRAIGGACKRNPFPLLIPCHRVIRSDGSLGGFALDLEIKRRLLFFEGYYT